MQPTRRAYSRHRPKLLVLVVTSPGAQQLVVVSTLYLVKLASGRFW